MNRARMANDQHIFWISGCVAPGLIKCNENVWNMETENVKWVGAKWEYIWKAGSLWIPRPRHIFLFCPEPFLRKLTYWDGFQPSPIWQNVQKNHGTNQWIKLKNNSMMALPTQRSFTANHLFSCFSLKNIESLRESIGFVISYSHSTDRRSSDKRGWITLPMFPQRRSMILRRNTQKTQTP